ncbi:MAG: hypothetical protein FH756_10435 [Firmicutes bacterium]|nr:hypothetical protein [Bacillota bacterium]
MEQQKPPLFSKGKIIFCTLLVALVLIAETVLHLNHLATWPAFACMILYFLAHMDHKQIPHILIGAFFGILNYPLLVMFVKVLAPVIGSFPAQLIYIGLFVGAIVLLKDHLPLVFNTNAFMLLVITAVAAKVPPAPEPYLWIAIQLVGGTALVMGVYGIQKIVASIMGTQQSAH